MVPLGCEFQGHWCQTVRFHGMVFIWNGDMAKYLSMVHRGLDISLKEFENKKKWFLSKVLEGLQEIFKLYRKVLKSLKKWGK